MYIFSVVKSCLPKQSAFLKQWIGRHKHRCVQNEGAPLYYDTPSYHFIGAFQTCLFYLLSNHKDIRERAAGDDDPEQHTLNERTNAHCFERLSRERCTDKEEGERDHVLGELIDTSANHRTHLSGTIANEGGIAQDIGVEQYGYDEPNNKHRDGLVPRFSFRAICCG